MSKLLLLFVFSLLSGLMIVDLLPNDRLLLSFEQRHEIVDDEEQNESEEDDQLEEWESSASKHLYETGYQMNAIHTSNRYLYSFAIKTAYMGISTPPPRKA